MDRLEELKENLNELQNIEKNAQSNLVRECARKTIDVWEEYIPVSKQAPVPSVKKIGIPPLKLALNIG